MWWNGTGNITNVTDFEFNSKKGPVISIILLFPPKKEMPFSELALPITKWLFQGHEEMHVIDDWS